MLGLVNIPVAQVVEHTEHPVAVTDHVPDSVDTGYSVALLLPDVSEEYLSLHCYPVLLLYLQLVL